MIMLQFSLAENGNYRPILRYKKGLDAIYKTSKSKTHEKGTIPLL
jgi:hypothetical protein